MLQFTRTSATERAAIRKSSWPRSEFTSGRSAANRNSARSTSSLIATLGKTDARPQFQKLLESASHGDFQVLLVWALDRCIGQSVAETFANVKKLLRYGVHSIGFTEPYFCTGGPAGAMIIPIAKWFTQQASRLISERTKAHLQAARAKSTRLGRPSKVFPRGRVAADRGLGLTWRQLEQKYGVPQATIRNAVNGLPPGHTGQSSPAGPKGESQ
jgi:DNA invertase Pin-like site-specific DNA recombinase